MAGHIQFEIPMSLVIATFAGLMMLLSIIKFCSGVQC